MDLDTFLTRLYVIVADWFREKEMAKQLKRSGPKPKLSDEEVLCLALAGQWKSGLPWDSERGLVRYMLKHGKKWFPQMLERSAFNARVRNLWRVFIHLQQDLAERLSGWQQAYEIVDTLPLPAATLGQAKARKTHWLPLAEVGHGGTQAGMYWGHQALLSISPQNAISGWLLASAAVDDRWLLQAFLSQRAAQAELLAPRAWRPSRSLLAPVSIGTLEACGKALAGASYLADRGFSGFRWQRHWYERYQAQVLSPPPVQQKAVLWPRTWRIWLKRLRQRIERVFAVLSQVFALKRLNAHSTWGLYTRMALVCAAFNLGLWMNQTLGRPALAHATLVC